jgi:hypothetical protein
MADVIFKLAVPLRQCCGHNVYSPWHIKPARRNVFNGLANEEFMGHVVYPVSQQLENDFGDLHKRDRKNDSKHNVQDEL